LKILLYVQALVLWMNGFVAHGLGRQ